MRSHAKALASTAGSTLGQAKGRGRIFRGALAARGGSPDAKGSGAPSSRRLVLPFGLFAAILAAGALLTALAGAATPAVITEPATNLTTTSATLNGTVNPEGEELSQCLFEYGKTSAYGQSAPCAESPATIGNGTSPVAVHADISGLDMASVYHFRLKAVNPSGTAQGTDQTLQTLGPVIKGTWTEDVVFKEATLRAEINPAAKATTYHFEWGTDTSYGNSSPEASVGSDSSDRKVSFFLEGLQPGTTYHYRVVATNSDAVSEGGDHTFTTYEPTLPDTDCPNQAFRVGASANLPDCRAYEMVSPVDKGGAGIVAQGTERFRAAYDRAAFDGEKITYTSSTSFGDATSNRVANQYLARRGPNGWTTHGISAPLAKSLLHLFHDKWDLDTLFQSFSEDLSHAWIQDHNALPLTPDAVQGFANIYRRDNHSNTYGNPVLTEAPLFYNAGSEFSPLLAPPSGGLQFIRFRGRSEDGSHVVFEANAQLTPDALASSTARQIYERSGGNLHLVSILPDGTPSPGESHVGTQTGLSRGTDLNRLNGRNAHVHRAVSEDGSRIFWTANATTPFTGRIYVRVDGQTTVPVSESVTPLRSRFWTASADGSKAVFSFDPSGSTSESQPSHDLYEFDVDTETPTLIAHGAYGVLGASDDLSHLYFISREVLDAGATAGEPNLYLRKEGGERFIATTNVTASLPGSDIIPGPVRLSPGEQNTRVTADGRHLAFMSDRSLTGYDNTDLISGKPAEEVFLYDADADELACISCNPSGARPHAAWTRSPYEAGEPEIKTGNWLTAAWIPTWEHEQYAARVLSEDGNRLFFNAIDALVPQDTNGYQDVYQWEAQGTGSCQRPGGCISLISTGKSATYSEFVDASADGRDIFIRTESGIDPRDPGLHDIYDAREGGGYPPPPPPPPSCVGDACQSVVAPPSDPTSASAGFRGVGDPLPRRRCGVAARRAARLSREAKQLRRKAKRVSSATQGKRMNRRSAQSAKRAKRLSRAATRCRRANRRVAR